MNIFDTTNSFIGPDPDPVPEESIDPKCLYCKKELDQVIFIKK